ncbi:MAG TPA: HNH endonuclease signature motif containing protein [Kofleriaceae bacterium]|nr:HNH endonuclease signature motif containing protein [Kofleriaceae bacterium]
MRCSKDLSAMTDDALLAALDQVLACSRCADAELVAHLGELDSRRLYLGQGCSSMFGYCTQVLRMSEGAAYLRIAAARASRRHPALLEMLADGRLHVSGVARLAPHTERGGLEFHHDDPFGKGGAHSVGNVRLVCRAHNVHLAERDYGTAHMKQFRSRAEEPRAQYAGWRRQKTGTGGAYRTRARLSQCLAGAMG